MIKLTLNKVDVDFSPYEQVHGVLYKKTAHTYTQNGARTHTHTKQNDMNIAK